MQQIAPVRSLKQAARILKHMHVQTPESGALSGGRPGGAGPDPRGADARPVGRPADGVGRGRGGSPAHGHFTRWLLAALGAIQLLVPRSRTCSAIDVLERYSRRGPLSAAGPRRAAGALRLRRSDLAQGCPHHQRHRALLPGGQKKNAPQGGVFSDRTSMERILFAVFTYEYQRKEPQPPSS